MRSDDVLGNRCRVVAWLARPQDPDHATTVEHHSWYDDGRHADPASRGHGIRSRRVRDEEIQRCDRGWEHLQFSVAPHPQRIGWTDPEAGDRLDVVVERLLGPGGDRHEEAGVEASTLADRGDPVIDEMNAIGQQQQTLDGAEIDERSGAVVDLVSGSVVPRRHLGVVEPDEIVISDTPGQQHTGLFEALTDRSDQPGQPAALHPHRRGCRGVVEAVADRFEGLAVIRIVDLAPGEHVLTTRENRRERPLQHEDLEPIVAVAHQHDGGGGPYRNRRGGYLVRGAHDERPYPTPACTSSVGTVEAPNTPDDVLDHIAPGTELIVPLANGEPTAVMDAIEQHADELVGIRVHQMHAIHDRRYLSGEFDDRMKHLSYFLSHVTRPYFASGAVGLIPAHFSEVFKIMRARTADPLVLAAASPPDRHGYFSLGVSADYTSSFIGRARFFLEVTEHMPRTFGRNQLHVSQVEGWCRSDRPLVEVPPREPDELDREIAGFVAERIPDGATIQTGIGAIPNAIMAALAGHRDLGIHTELLSDGVVDLMEAGVVNGIRKDLNRTKTVGTFALGTQRLHEFLHENTAVELWPVRYVNDPGIIGRERGFVSINATLSVDFIGQCASETIDGHYYSSSGGQNDFARGAMNSQGGQGFVVLHSTTSSGTSRIVPRLASGDVITTPKNTVDKVVTEYGVAELRGRSIRERTRALISVAHPDHRDELTAEAVRMHFL